MALPRPARVPFTLPDSLHQRLNMYALSASAAGVSALALAQPAEAKVVYTPKYVQLNWKPLPIDLNKDGKVDFFLLQTASASMEGRWENLFVCHQPAYFSGYGYHCESSTSGSKNARNQVVVGHSARFAEALRAKTRIGKGDLFGGYRKKVAMGGVVSPPGTSRTYWVGSWMNGGKGVKSRYLGLKFQINGKFHFGWARLTVTTQKASFTATLTGYAYETVPGKAIVAGQTKDDNAYAGSLGVLALGGK